MALNPLFHFSSTKLPQSGSNIQAITQEESVDTTDTRVK